MTFQISMRTHRSFEKEVLPCSDSTLVVDIVETKKAARTTWSCKSNLTNQQKSSL